MPLFAFFAPSRLRVLHEILSLVTAAFPHETHARLRRQSIRDVRRYWEQEETFDGAEVFRAGRDGAARGWLAGGPLERRAWVGERFADRFRAGRVERARGDPGGARRCSVRGER